MKTFVDGYEIISENLNSLEFP